MEGISEGGEQRQPEDPRGEEFCVGDAIDFQDNFVQGKWYAGTITKKEVKRYQKEENGPFITYWSFAAKQKTNGKTWETLDIPPYDIRRPRTQLVSQQQQPQTQMHQQPQPQQSQSQPQQSMEVTRTGTAENRSAGQVPAPTMMSFAHPVPSASPSVLSLAPSLQQQWLDGRDVTTTEGSFVYL
jgi:hypothetical protein